MSDLWATLAAAWVLGLLGAGHCFAMCGGIVAALSFAAPEPTGITSSKRGFQLGLNLGYNFGRILSYTVIGAIAAAAAAAIPPTGWPVARTIAGLLLLAMGLYLAGWWRGLLWLERGGQLLWRRLKPLGDRFLPLDSPAKAVAVGMVWGWLPCGLVYAALGYAAVQTQAVTGAVVMLAFGLGTLPALLVGGVFASRLKSWLANPRVRLLLALAYLAFGAWTLGGAWYHQLMHGDAEGLHQRSGEGHQHHSH